MPNQEAIFIVRSRFRDSRWFFWSQGKKDQNWMFNPDDKNLVLFSLNDAREFVQTHLEQKGSGYFIQIRPFECGSADPRIEDYQSGVTYDWAANPPREVKEEAPEPEILIIVEGGLIQEMLTTLPKLRVQVLDNDLYGIGENPHSEYELSGEPKDQERIQLLIVSTMADFNEETGEAEDDDNF